MNRNDEESFLQAARGLLDEGMRNLDARTEQRLERARMRALEAAGEGSRESFLRRRWVMFGSFATAATAAIAAFLWLNASPGVLPARQVEDFEIITSREKIDFYQNLDFYRWLAAGENEKAAGKAS